MRKRHRSVFSTLTALVIAFHAAVSLPAFAAGRIEHAIRAAYEVEAGDPLARARARFSFDLHGDEAVTIPLLPAGIPLSSAEGCRPAVRFVQEGGRYAVRLPGRGRYEAILEFPLRTDRRDGGGAVGLPLLESAVATVTVRTAEPDMEFHATPSVPIEALDVRRGSAARLYPAGIRSLEISWRPERPDIEPEAVLPVP